MFNWNLDNCTYYEKNLIFPIYVFDEHNMALAVWGTYRVKENKPLHLITFDYHTDTRPPFNQALSNNYYQAEFGAKALKIPYVRSLLANIKYKANDFKFQDVYKISDFIKNDEQIQTAYTFQYLNSYHVIHRSNEASGFQKEDRLNNLNATYINANDFSSKNITSIEAPIALDFDLDFFTSRKELSQEFFTSIKYLIKNAAVITIAREPKYFNTCKTEKDFTNQEAEDLLISGLLNILNE